MVNTICNSVICFEPLFKLTAKHNKMRKYTAFESQSRNYRSKTFNHAEIIINDAKSSYESNYSLTSTALEKSVPCYNYRHYLLMQKLSKPHNMNQTMHTDKFVSAATEELFKIHSCRFHFRLFARNRIKAKHYSKFHVPLLKLLDVSSFYVSMSTPKFYTE